MLVSGLICKRGNPASLINAFKDNEFELITSLQLMDEFIEVIERPHLKDNYRLTDEEIKDFIEYIFREATIISGTYQVRKSADSKDNMFLACALEGKVDYLVTGDPHLGNLKYYYGV
ncbi:MAG: putative toxin-antitoxin system toxin component, PIN family [bacterium]|nr:putative toxin-antitoxin system toxin component, PIN family [bacterium]